MLLNSASAPRFILVAGIGLLLATVARAEELRKWTDSTGQFELQAKFISVEDGVVSLVREDGSKMSIALDKLSKADQEYVASVKSANPFKAAGNSPFKASMEPKPKPQPSSQGPREVTVDWSKSEVIALDGTASGWKEPSPSEDGTSASWNITPPSTDASDFRAKTVGLASKEDFFEKLSGVGINIVAKKAVVGYVLGNPSIEGTSRITICDLARGRATASASTPGQMIPIGLHDDGEHVLMRRTEFGFGKSDRLEIWSIEGKEVVKSLIWTPFDDVTGGQRDVMWAEFIDSNTLAISSRGGRVALFNVATAQPICHFETSEGAVPAMSADRKWIAFCSTSTMGLFDVEKREVAVAQSTPEALTWPFMAFSPSGRRLGCIAQDRILVWDTATGQLEKNFKTPGIHIHGNIDFPDDGFILCANQFLVALDTQLKLWQYKGLEYARTVGGTTFLAVSGFNAPGTLAAAKLPHPAALSMLENATKQPDLFVFRKGTPVKLNVTGIQDAHRKRVSDALTKKLELMKCPVQADAAVEIVAKVEGPKQKEIRFWHSGEYKVKEYLTKLEFMYQGKVIWKASGTNVPHFVSLKKGENLEGVLRKASAQPAYAYYDNIVFPEFLQKPSESQAAGAGQTMGACSVTPTGFR